VLLPELAWNADFLVGLVAGRAPLGLAAYMFDRKLPLWLRALSLFHIALPPLLLFTLHRLGYDERAWPTLIPVSWGVLIASYLFTDEKHNINWVFGPGSKPQRVMPPPLYLALEMAVLPLFVFLPTHLILERLF
jgi:hypothetical protein